MPKITQREELPPEQVDGSEALPVVKAGMTRRATLGALAAPTLALAGASTAAAGQARDRAAGLELPENLFVEADLGAAVAAAEGGTATGTAFKAVGTAEGLAQVRVRTSGGSELLYEEVTRAGLLLGSGAAQVNHRQDHPDAMPLPVADWLAETVWPDQFRQDGDPDDRASFARAVAYLVARNGRAGGTIQLRMGRVYQLPGSVTLAPGIVVRGQASLPLYPPGASPEFDVVNTSGDPTFVYAPPSPGSDDRLACPSVIGVRMKADACIDFGVDDEQLGYFMANGRVVDCFFRAYTDYSDTEPGGHTAIRIIENYRGGVEHCWIEGYKTGVIQKSGDFNEISRNRIRDCCVDIAVLSPASTGSGTIIQHNDLLASRAAFAHPEFGGAYSIYSEDRWIAIRDNYFESGYEGLTKDALIKLVEPESRIDTADISTNRFDYNDAQATFKYDFSAGMPLNLLACGNRSGKGPTALTAVAWPARTYLAAGPGIAAQRRLDWRDTQGSPPMRWREPGADLTLDAGSVAILTSAQGALLYADNNAICFDYDHAETAENGGPGAECVLWLPYTRGSDALSWDIEVEYSGDAGVEFDFQPRNGPGGFVDGNTLTCTAARQVFRRFGVERTDLVFLVAPSGSVDGILRIHAVRLRRAAS